jgi:beta-lactamase regulating signal transducer with metallopeptidase domain
MAIAWTIAANLAVATIMAMVVAISVGLRPLKYQPRLRHALWLLVVAKLVTLPLVELPLLPSESLGIESHWLDQKPVVSRDQCDVQNHRREPTPGATAVVGREGGSVYVRSEATVQDQGNMAISAEGAVNRSLSGRTWWLAFGGIVGIPTALVMGASLRQMRRVARLIRRATMANERLVRIAAEASRSMGLGVIPEVRIVGDRLTPLLWIQRGGPVVVLPRALVERMDDDQVGCIICHELAHFMRRDHWANAFALCVAAVYWWYPVAWWARRELLATQEQCCDLLVISKANIARRRYAETLLEAIEFINNERPLLPALASGFGRVSALRRRFEMIAINKTPHRSSMFAVVLVLLCGVAFFCVPVQGQKTEVVGEGNREFVGQDASTTETADANAAAEPGEPDKARSQKTRKVNAATAIPMVEKATLDYRTAEVTVDPRKHCLNAGQPSTAGQGALRIDLERGTTYKVSAAGAAWMTSQTGNDADPFPGILFYYGTDEEDGYAIRYTVLKPGDSITFKTPWLIAPDDEVFALAFFISAWPHTEQHGNCRLTFTRATEEDKFDDSRAAVSDFERPRLKFLGR